MKFKEYINEEIITPNIQNELSAWNLFPLLNKKYITVYHGTTALFKKFNIDKSRSEFNKNYYGDGIFFTPEKKIAIQYANANRNIGLPKSIILKLKTVNKEDGIFLEELYTLGNETWKLDKYQKENKYGGIGDFPDNANLLSDIAEWIIGSKLKLTSSKSNINFFNPSTGTPSWVYDTLEEIGIDSFEYVPKIYNVKVKANNVLITSKLKEASTAKQKGYDAVIFRGRNKNLVGGAPEVAIFNFNNITIKNIEKA